MNIKSPSVIISFTLLALLLPFLGSLIGVRVAYHTADLSTVTDRRDEVANSLANYIAASSAIFYTEQDFISASDDPSISKNSPYFVKLYETEHNDYEKFITATTKLASEVPADMRDEVVSIEIAWQELPENIDDNAPTQWFDKLNSVRDSINNRLTTDKLLDPLWKNR